jgi:allantoinase
MDGQAFLSHRVVTPAGIQSGAVLVRDGKIGGIVPANQIPGNFVVHDFAESAILPGLVDSHLHINDPGRSEWEGFESATRAAAAGGYTTLVDMPLNCLPPTATVAALAAKRKAAEGRCWVDWLAWGGIVSDNQSDIEASIPESMVSLWSPRPNFAPRCLMWLERAFPCWSTPNFPAP